MSHPYVRESPRDDCEPSMRYRATLPDGTMIYRGTLVEAMAELPGLDYGWRDVRHELPDPELEVVTWDAATGYRWLACWSGSRWYDSENFASVAVTHWMDPGTPR